MDPLLVTSFLQASTITGSTTRTQEETVHTIPEALAICLCETPTSRSTDHTPRPLEAINLRAYGIYCKTARMVNG